MDIVLILILQLVYVPISTLRTIMLVKGQSTMAASLGFVEALIYVFGLSVIFSGDQNIWAMIVYAVGFGLGIVIGSMVEKKLALGYTTLMVNVPEKDEEFIEELRTKGYGVTVFEGEGREKKRYKLEILFKRNRQEDLLSIIEDGAPSAFVIAYEPTYFQGGFLVKAMKKNRKKKVKKG